MSEPLILEVGRDGVRRFEQTANSISEATLSGYMGRIVSGYGLRIECEPKSLWYERLGAALFGRETVEIIMPYRATGKECAAIWHVERIDASRVGLTAELIAENVRLRDISVPPAG